MTTKEAVQERFDALTKLVRIRLNILIASIAFLFLVAIAGGIYVVHQAQINHDALCAFRGSVQTQLDTSLKFLSDHPNGIGDFTPDIIQASIVQFQTTLAAIDSSGLHC